MGLKLGLRLVKRLQRRAGQFELSARLQRDRPAAIRPGQADDMAGIDDRLPAEPLLHALQQGTDATGAGAPLIGDGSEIALIEREFLVLGADPEGRGLFLAVGDPRNQFGLGIDRGRIGHVASHGRSGR